MKNLMGIYLIVLSNIAYCQFAIIQDKDGYCNVRDASNTSSRVTDKLENGHVVYCLSDHSNWIDIDYAKNTKAFDFGGKVY